MPIKNVVIHPNNRPHVTKELKNVINKKKMTVLLRGPFGERVSREVKMKYSPQGELKINTVVRI